MAENTIQWDKDADGIVTLTLDDPTGSANVMNEHYIESMGKAVERLVAEKDSITGVVFHGRIRRISNDELESLPGQWLLSQLIVSHPEVVLDLRL